MRPLRSKYCNDCGMPAIHHIRTWIDDIFVRLPQIRAFGFDRVLARLFESGLILIGLVSFRDDFDRAKIPLRSRLVIEAGERRGMKFAVLEGPFGYTNQFRVRFNGKTVRFEGLPAAVGKSRRDDHFTDDKERTKQKLRSGGFPAPEGAAFWFFRRQKAIKYAAEKLGFPVVVKPRSGSVARHVTTDIQNKEELGRAISHAIRYAPEFMIERYVAGAFVHRVTVVDFETIACVRQVAAYVIGDGVSTIAELIRKKNADPVRNRRDNNRLLYPLPSGEDVKVILQKQRYMIASIPKSGERIMLARDPFLRLGGDLVEETSRIHPATADLVRRVAQYFDMRLVGIDIMAEDIARPWDKQTFVILELNSVPNIELHHFPSSGDAQDIAGAVTNLLLKYY